MPELEPSRSAPTPSSAPRVHLSPGRHLQRVFSAQHLDDISNYHDGDHDSKEQDGNIETEYSDELEQVRNEDDDEAARKGEDEVPEVRMGVLDTRDLEANLEKKKSTRSIKDPNLVRLIDCNLCKMTV